MNKPRVSICLLTYNRAPILGRTIESLLNQTFKDFELLVNDDRSKDDTEQLVAEYVKRDSRVRYFKNPRNLRYSGNQNAAFHRANTDLIAYVHDGDVYRADMIEKWVEALDRYPSAGFVFNSQQALDERGKVVYTHTHPFAPLTNGRIMFDHIVWPTSIPIWGILMLRRSVLADVGLFDLRFPVLADVDMWLRILLKYDVAYVGEPLYALCPREKGHPNSVVTWRIERERVVIAAINVARRAEQDPVVGKHLRTAISYVWRTATLANIFWCLKNLKLGRIPNGIKLYRDIHKITHHCDTSSKVVTPAAWE